MDVRCELCSTDYDFDDALISERGTTVKCTNCGHQFRIFPRSGVGAPERWVVRTGAGEELVYTSLKGLQKAIGRGQIAPTDLLSRGTQQPRRLGTIAELEPFFAPKPVPRDRKPITLHGVAPPANTVRALPNVRGARVPVTPGAIPSTESTPHSPWPATSGVGSTQPAPYAPAGALMLQESPSDPGAAPAPYVAVEPAAAAGLERTQRTAEYAALLSHRTVRGIGKPSAGLEGTLRMGEPDLPVGESVPATTASGAAPMPTTLPHGAARALQESVPPDDDAQDQPVGVSPLRRTRLRWIAGLVVASMLALLGATVGKKYITRLSPPSGGSKIRDQRVVGYLDRGNQLLDEGDLEGAKESFDKASVLAEEDPAVLVSLAHLETVRADLLWLKVRLLAPADNALLDATRKQLVERVAKAQNLVDRAAQVSPEEQEVSRAQVNLFRMKGNLTEARAHIGTLSSNATHPRNAYALAALDLAERTPAWSSVIDRLHAAAAAERGRGRAQAALVYALALSGKHQEAGTELRKLSAGHPLLLELTAFVGRHAEPVADDGGVELVQDSVPAVPLHSTPAKSASGEVAIAAGDFRAQLEQASKASKSGDLGRAERLYQAVLARQPRNTEALAGLGDVARQRGDSARALQYYNQVLSNNPSYLPALVGAADMKWASGDRKGALVLYKRIQEQAGHGSSYGQRAAERIKQAEGPAAAESPETPNTPEPPQRADSPDLPESRQ